LPVVVIQGRCHCGNIQAHFSTRRSESELGPRTCSCRFCSAQAAVYIADAKGSCSIEIIDPEAVTYYRFGERTTDYLICTRCGIFIATLICEGPRSWSALNLNTTEYAALPAGEDSAWQDQTAAERVIFRQTRWTPTRIQTAVSDKQVITDL
jgi:hypothetical protein